MVEEPADEEPLLDPLELRPRGLPMIGQCITALLTMHFH